MYREEQQIISMNIIRDILHEQITSKFCRPLEEFPNNNEQIMSNILHRHISPIAWNLSGINNYSLRSEITVGNFVLV
jgi:hypothetical protein